ncbi:MAG: imidazole glycerol phosphate synthase subunit HisF [Aquisalinus sp.]|nr:imidazole glycerol phosphate synthase subunit HisF [Aquisalinus sp.]
MLARRIIPCLDVRDGKVVKGVQFRDHEIVGDIIECALRYRDEGADELVLYDITASPENRSVDISWVRNVARVIDIPFSVAGGIRTSEQARAILDNGADKISVNSPALEQPDFIDELVSIFGSQCIVVGVDSLEEDGQYYVHQYTGKSDAMVRTRRLMVDWIIEAQQRGAGEIVLNCMNQDGVRKGYDTNQLSLARSKLTIPLIASGGAGAVLHFKDVFEQADVSGALAASVFHKNVINIQDLKQELASCGLPMRR